MRFIGVWIVLFCVAVIEATNPRSVNLAIEASVLLEPEDVKQNNVVLTKIRRFLDQIGKAFAPVEEPVFRTDSNGVFTSFITKICNTILKYDDKDLKTLQQAMIYAAEPTPDYILDKNNEVLKFIHYNLKYLGTCQLDDLKNKLRNYLKNGNDVLPLEGLENYYNDTHMKNFENVVTKFENYSQTLENLTTIVSEALKTVIFDRYKDLKEPERSQFNIEINKIQNHINSLAKKKEDDKLKLKMNQNDTIISETKKNDLTNEIVFNKDIVINVGGDGNREEGDSSKKSQDESETSSDEDDSV